MESVKPAPTYHFNAERLLEERGAGDGEYYDWPVHMAENSFMEPRLSSPSARKLITIYIDADACPVKQEVYRVAERHALKGVDLKVLVVSNSPIAVPRDHALIERVVVGPGMDEADNWIAERAQRGDIVVTADVPLASRCVKAGATVIAPNGKPFTEDTIGMTLATRNLMDSLRSAGEITGGPKSFAPRDRSAFLSALDQAIVRLMREGFGFEASNG
jgi:uncharacterized protein YaiI (UPF0178 family)